MKRLSIICALASIAVTPLVAQDVIVTKDAKKIEAKITEVSKSEIKYKEFDYQDGPTFTLSVEEINSIIYANGKEVLYNQKQELMLDVTEETAEILLLDGQKIVGEINEMRDEYVAYTSDGRYQTISALRVEKITFLKDGHIKQYDKKISSSVTNTETNIKYELNIARAANYSGIYVFTDCTPVSEYEVIGDVYFDKEGEQHATTLYYFNPYSKTVNSAAHTYTETPQYTDIRDGLIAQAVMANRQVEGVIISVPKEGEGRATLIKFKEDTNDKSLAKASSHLGVIVFIDCMPVNTYSFVGKINSAGGVSTDYNILRDRLIKKAKKKYPIVQGIIPRFVSGGSDTAEVIRF